MSSGVDSRLVTSKNNKPKMTDKQRKEMEKVRRGNGSIRSADYNRIMNMGNSQPKEEKTDSIDNFLDKNMGD